jgi:hypothetical protein
VTLFLVRTLAQDVVDCVTDGLDTLPSAELVLSLLRVLFGLLGCCANMAPPALASAHDGDSDSENDSNSPSASPNQAWQQLVVRIAEAAVHFIGSLDAYVIHAAYSVLRRACHALAAAPKVLYPLLHRLWPHVVPRLRRPTISSSHANIAAYASLEFVCALMTDLNCASFLRSRFVETVWPAARAALQRGCPWALISHLSAAALELHGSSHHESTDVVVTLTADERVLAAVLRMLSAMSSQPAASNVIQPLAWDVCCVVIPYLSSASPQALQQECRQLLSALARNVDADLVWLFLARIAPGNTGFDHAGGGLPSFTLGCDINDKHALRWTGYSSLQPAALAAGVTSVLHDL